MSRQSHFLASVARVRAPRRSHKPCDLILVLHSRVLAFLGGEPDDNETCSSRDAACVFILRSSSSGTTSVTRGRDISTFQGTAEHGVA